MRRAASAAAAAVLVVAITLVATANATATIQSSSIKIRRFTNGPDMDFHAAVVETSWSEEIALRLQLLNNLANLTRAYAEVERQKTIPSSGLVYQETRLSKLIKAVAVPSATDPDNTPATITPSILAASGIGALNCSRPANDGDGSPVIFPSDQPINNITNTPHGMYVLQPSDTPAPTVVRVLGGLPRDASTLHSDRVSFFLPINGTWGGKVFHSRNLTLDKLQSGTWLCSLVFSPPNKNNASLISWNTNATIAMQTPVIPVVPNVCSATDHAAMQRSVAYTTAALRDASASSIPSVHLANQLQLASASLGLYEARDACNRDFATYYTTRNTTLLIDPLTTSVIPEGRVGRCPYSPNTPEWVSSPCCSPIAAFSACCGHDEIANTTAFVPILAPGIVLSSDVTPNPVLFKALMASHAETMRDMQAHIDTKPVVDVAMWRQLSEIVSTCEKSTTTGQTCRSHGDCRHHPFLCNSELGLCHFDWDRPEMAMSRCLLERMDDRLRSEWLVNWNIDASLDDESLVTAFASAMVSQASDVDCTGPSSALHRRRLNTTFDPITAEAIVVIQPANQTSCVAKQVCNWDPHRITDAATCNGTASRLLYGTHMCGLKVGGNSHYTDLRREPRCYVPDLAFRLQPTNVSANDPFADGSQCLRSPESGVALSYANDGTPRCHLSVRRNTSACYDLVRSPFCSKVLDYLTNSTALINRTDPYDPSLVDTLQKYCNLRTPQTVTGSGTRSFCYSFNINATTCAAMAAQASATATPLLTPSDLGGLMPLWIARNLRFDAALGMCYGHFSYRGFNDVTSGSAYDYGQVLNETTCRVVSQRLHPAHDPSLMKMHLALEFVPGSYHTQELCAPGLCAAPSRNYSGVAPTDCAAASKCSRSCGRCIATVPVTSDVVPSFCFGPLTGCTGGAGTGINGTTVMLNGTAFCHYPHDRHLCMWKGYDFYSCANVTNSRVCALDGIHDPSAVAEHAARALSCRWSDNEPCLNQVECEAPATSGKCTDYDATLCTCTARSGCTCDVGACVEPWRVDTTTGLRHTCLLGQPGISQISIGCKNSSANTAALCGALGGSWEWHTRARTNDTCLGYGRSCPSSENGGVGNYLTRSDAECKECGVPSGTINKVNFLPGVSAPGAIQTLEWLNRTMVPENQYKLVLSFARLQAIVNRFALRVMMAQIQRAVGVIHARPAALVAAYVQHRTAATAGTAVGSFLDPRIGYDPTTGLITPVVSCTIYASGPAQGTLWVQTATVSPRRVCDAGRASLTFEPGSIQGKGNLLVQMSFVEHGLLLANMTHVTGQSSTSKASPPVGLGGVTFAAIKSDDVIFAPKTTTTAPDGSAADDTANGYLIPAENYALVTDAHGNRVGSIIGSGVFIQFNGTVTSFVLQIEQSQGIDIDTATYPVYDFGVESPPLGIVPTYTDGVTKNGLVLMGTVDESVCPPSTDSVIRCTLYPIIRKGSSSGLAAWQIALIVVGSVLGFTAIVGGSYYAYTSRARAGFKPVGNPLD